MYFTAGLEKAIASLVLFSSYFKQQVSWDQSTVKIADEVPRDDNSTINAVYFTAGLEKLFKETQAEDPTLRFVQNMIKLIGMFYIH